MAHSRTITDEEINYMSMTEYAEFRKNLQNPNSVKFVRTYEYCARMYVETGQLYWLNEMLDRVSP